MNTLEAGKTYSTTDIRKFMNVGTSTWEHNKNKLLDNFSLYYEYEVEYSGRNTNYKILKKLGDYQKPPNKRDKTKRDSTYAEEIVHVIKEDNVQTAMNVARIIGTTEPIVQFNHSAGTVYEYTRVRMRALFGNGKDQEGTIGTISNKIWCRLDAEHNVYIPLTQEQITQFYDYFREECSETEEAEMDLLCDYTNGLITKTEFNSIIGEISFNHFKFARDRFLSKYGFYPIKVPEYTFYEDKAEL